MKRFQHRLQWSAVFWLLILAAGFLIFTPRSPTLVIQSEQVRADPFTLTPLPPLPISQSDTNLNLSAKAYSSIDAASGVTLLSSQAGLKLPPASTEKLLLAWVVRKACPLNQVVRAKSAYPLGTVIGIEMGEEFHLGDLLKATLIPSANDAATVLAEGCFGSTEKAVEEMNRRIVAWHLTGSHFTNPTGLDEAGNYTTAADLARLAVLVTADPAIAEITSTARAVIANVAGTKTYNLYSTNRLLGVAGIDGIKTGQTEQALENLIASSSLEHRVVTVVLGSIDRFGDTLKLLTEIRRVYRWQVDPYQNLGASLRDTNPIK